MRTPFFAPNKRSPRQNGGDLSFFPPPYSSAKMLRLCGENTPAYGVTYCTRARAVCQGFAEKFFTICEGSSAARAKHSITTLKHKMRQTPCPMPQEVFCRGHVRGFHHLVPQPFPLSARMVGGFSGTHVCDGVQRGTKTGGTARKAAPHPVYFFVCAAFHALISSSRALKRPSFPSSVGR